MTVKRSILLGQTAPLFPVFAALLLSWALHGCAPKAQDTLVARIGTTPITLTDYEKLYVKSNGSRDAGVQATQEEREKFLDLMIKYRLKLTDAYRKGMDKRTDLLSEIQQYKGSLAASYLTDRTLVSPAVRKMYDRTREEIRASHILLTFKQGATAEDSAAVNTRAAEIIAEVKAGQDFGQIAANESADPSAKQNRGDLYYFSVGRMVPEFEDAAYDLKAGEVTSTPVKTRFGIHIIKVTDRKPSAGERRCSHIMIRFPNMNPTPDDTAAALAKIQPLMDSLKQGADFAELARRNSEDGGSSNQGGDLGWFSRGRWPQPFDEAAFLLSTDQLSPVIRTAYGYHIIKCTDSRPPKSFEEARQNLQNTYQEQRFPAQYAEFLAGIRKEVGFLRIDSVAQKFTTAFDSTRTTRDSTWTDTLDAGFRRTAMFRVNSGPISVDSVVAIIKSHLEWSNLSLHRITLSSTLDKVAEQITFSAKADLLERQDPEFAALLREYREGILLYQAEQEQVWNRVVTSDSVLREYFEKNRDKFTYPDRVRFTEIRAANETQGKNIRTLVDAGKTFEQIVAEDSVRMKLPTTYPVQFAAGKSALSKAAQQTLSTVGAQMTAEPMLRIMLTSYPDTSTRKKQNEAIAAGRVEVVKTHLMEKYGIPAERILSESRAQRFAAAREKDTAGLLQQVRLQLIGRQPLVISPLEQHLLAPEADERARYADSLAPGSVSVPFFFKVGYSLVRLEGRDPARHKTFDEAGAEVSSSFQDYEAKRLESEWLNRVRREHPVVEYRENLGKAFAPLQQ